MIQKGLAAALVIFVESFMTLLVLELSISQEGLWHLLEPSCLDQELEDFGKVQRLDGDPLFRYNFQCSF
jgi:hypothetical protein